YEKKWMKKGDQNIFPIELLDRSRELEYIRYIKDINAKSKEDNRVIPGIMLRKWIEPEAVINIDPDEQAVYLPKEEWENKNVNNKESESIFEKSVVSPTGKSTVQLLRHAATSENDLLNDGEFKKGLELSTELEQQPNINGTFEKQNITEVYEQPFIQIYVKPLCKGLNC
ncbi:unnamed protein product, partial [Acanthocheilonema viteae]